MQDFHSKLEVQTGLDIQRRTEGHKVMLGAALGVLSVTALVRYGFDAHNIKEYTQALYGTLPGALTAESIIQVRKNNS
jgi:hypothetical protein